MFCCFMHWNEDFHEDFDCLCYASYVRKFQFFGVAINLKSFQSFRPAGTLST